MIAARVALAGLCLLGIAVACALMPLAIYTTSLALFGLAHVATELRYVDRRFSARIPRAVIAVVALVIAAVLAVRGLGVVGLLSPWLSLRLELGAVALLALAALPVCAHWGRRGAAVGLGVALLLGLGAVFVPLATLMLLAVGHNWTPVGFFWDAATPDNRVGLLMLTLTGFVAMPLLLASGIVQGWLGASLWDVSLLSSGGLDAQLSVYLHPVMARWPSAGALFSAAVFAQCMHYLAVLVVLPQLGGHGQPLVRWPSWPQFAAGIVLASAVLFVGYAVDFSSARLVYGFAAAVHAWLEIPLLCVVAAALIGSRASGHMAR